MYSTQANGSSRSVCYTVVGRPRTCLKILFGGQASSRRPHRRLPATALDNLEILEPITSSYAHPSCWIMTKMRVQFWYPHILGAVTESITRRGLIFENNTCTSCSPHEASCIYSKLFVMAQASEQSVSGPCCISFAFQALSSICSGTSVFNNMRYIE